MKKKLTTEIFWIIGVAILTNLIWYSVLGNLLTNGRLLEIQNHDTFLIVSKSFLIGLTFVVVLSFMYLLRWIYIKEINRRPTIVIAVLATLLLILLFIPWLASLEVIYDLGRSLYAEVNGMDRIQMTLLSHMTLTLTIGLVVLFDMTIGYKLVTKKK